MLLLPKRIARALEQEGRNIRKKEPLILHPGKAYT